MPKLFSIPFAVLVLLLASVLFASDKPNIVIILSDDMGYSDLGCYGGEIPTPHLDSLGMNGIRFTQFYNSARCCPTRASLLTGLHPHQTGVGHMTETNIEGLLGFQGDLNTSCVTIAQVLRMAGYKNYCVGKWHITGNHNKANPKINWPLQRGFDRFYGILGPQANFFVPRMIVRDNVSLTPANDAEYQPEQPYYLTDAITDHAIRYIAEHKANHTDSPFFLYVPYLAAHLPLHAPEDEIKKFAGKYDDGYTPIREARYARMKEIGLLPENVELSPQAGNWEGVEFKDWESRCMEVYAAMIHRMDHGIGRLIEALKKTGQHENTVIMFLHDNGASSEATGRVRTQENPGQNEPAYGLTKAQRGDESLFVGGKNLMPGPMNTFMGYGRNWANVSNTPFREYKHFVHEGGIATPLIVYSPTKVDISMRGKYYRDPGQLVDIMATCVELAGAEYPKEFEGNAIQPMEGVSLAPALTGKPLVRSKPLVWEHEGNRAIRDGKWKLVAKGPLRPWELYDIEADRSELHDLSKKFPETTESLAKQWNEWAERTNVLPWPWVTKE